MTVGQIFTKIGSFIENKQIFMLLNWNCAKLANFEKKLSILRVAVFSWTQCIYGQDNDEQILPATSWTKFARKQQKPTHIQY